MNATINPTIEEGYANLTEPRGTSGAIWTGRV
jgi:hypothetical protein